MKRQIILACLLLASFFFLSAELAGQVSVKMAVEVDDLTQRHGSLVRESMEQAIVEIQGYQIVERKQADYIMKGELLSAREVVFDGVPAVIVHFALRVFDRDKTGVNVLVNNTVSKRLVGVILEDGLREVIRDVVKNSLMILGSRSSNPRQL